MIHEHAVIEVQPGREEEFEAVFGQVPAIFAQAAGCHGVELRRCVEEPSRFVLLVAWETLEDHTVGFRESPLFGEWRGLVGGFFATPPQVRHYAVVA